MLKFKPAMPVSQRGMYLAIGNSTYRYTAMIIH